MDRRKSVLLGSLVLLILFAAINALVGAALRSWRVDLTEDDLYSLSEGARSVARGLDEPLRLELFLSGEVIADKPFYKNYAERVQEVLDEFVREAGGLIRLRVRDPQPFSEAEDDAATVGLAGIRAGAAGTRLYMGLVGRNSVDDEETIPFLSPQKETFLEYDVARMIHALSQPRKSKVGLLSSLTLSSRFDPQNPGRPSPAWQALEQIESLFEVETLRADTLTAVPDDVDVLWIVHPKGLGDEALYAIDQYVLGGGRAVVFVDPHCEVDESGADPNNPMASMQADKSSDLGPLFEAWGVEYDPGKVVADKTKALRVSRGGAQGIEGVDFVIWLGLDEEVLADGDPTTGELGLVNLAVAGELRHAEGASSTFEPLMRSSKESMALDVETVKFFPEPARLVADFQTSGVERVIAARLGGTLRSAFPDGPPSPAASAEPADEEGESPSPGEHLASSQGEAAVVIVADVDVLHDRLWITEERMGPISLGWRVLADNGAFLLNTVEMLAGSSDLISIRGRAQSARPFEVVRELEREAQEKYLTEEQRLQEEIRATEQEINQMQREAPGESTLILSPEQEAALEKLEEELLEARKKLRAVQFNLRSDIERLGTRLMWINVGSMPAAVLVLALVLAVHRGRQRSRARRQS